MDFSKRVEFSTLKEAKRVTTVEFHHFNQDETRRENFLLHGKSEDSHFSCIST